MVGVEEAEVQCDLLLEERLNVFCLTLIQHTCSRTHRWHLSAMLIVVVGYFEVSLYIAKFSTVNRDIFTILKKRPHDKKLG